MSHFFGLIAFSFVSIGLTQSARGQVDVDFSFKAGHPKPWQGGWPITKFSTVNARWGNCFSAIPLVGWSGRGPDMNFTLYHNSLATVSGLELGIYDDYSFGKGWSASFYGRLHEYVEGVMLYLADDGTVVRFDANTSGWSCAPGFYLKLTPDDDEWLVTAKDGSYRRFDSNGNPLEIVDASGNAIVIDYTTNGTTDAITDASGRALQFHYDDTTNGTRLTSIEAPLDANSHRTWSFDYTTNGWLEAVHDPLDRTIGFVYDSAGRIREVHDQNDNFSLITYTYGLVSLVNDPGSYDGQTQSFAYDADTNGNFSHTYTDRRGKDWVYAFHSESMEDFNANLIAVTDPLSHTTSINHDAQHNLISRTDALIHTWSYDYDSNGNTTATTNPLGQTTELAYDGLNNLTSITPPADDYGGANTNKIVMLAYEDNDNPTRVTSITEPADGLGGSASVTTLSYYGPSDSTPYGTGAWAGQLKQVLDANGVSNFYKYDARGQFKRELEGAGEGGSPEYGDVFHAMSMNDAGWPTTMSSPYNSNLGVLTYDAGGELTNVSCEYSFVETNVQAVENPLFPFFPSLLNSSLSIGCFSATYDNLGRITEASACVTDSITSESSDRSVAAEYDELDRVRSMLKTSAELTFDANSSGVHLSREFTYTPDWSGDTDTRTGPDGQENAIVTDDAGRPIFVTRDSHVTETQYDEANRPVLVIHPNGRATAYEYDEANRLTAIRHITDSNTDTAGTILALEYDYSADGLITGITEIDDNEEAVAWVTYDYDNRNRLVHESRTGNHEYDLTYTYDDAGNRMSKVNNATGDETSYIYDSHDTGTFTTNANRLMLYEVHDANSNLLETTTYAYDVGGSAKQIVRKIEGDDTYRRTYFVYDKQGRTWLTVQDQYELDGETPINVVRLSVREFRYDGSGRQRYLMRDRNTNGTLIAGDASTHTVWSDYNGDTVYADLTLTDANSNASPYPANGVYVAEQASHQPGDYSIVAEASPEFSVPLTDHLGTTRVLTDESGEVVVNAVFTAFGEPVNEYGQFGDPSPLPGRYGYVGAQGYEGGAGLWGENQLPYLHLGERLYDPTIGRFLQRDPIGINGGINVYLYAHANPVQGTDPSGLWDDVGWENVFRNWDRMTPAQKTEFSEGAGLALGLGLGGVGIELGGAACIGARWIWIGFTGGCSWKILTPDGPAWQLGYRGNAFWTDPPFLRWPMPIWGYPYPFQGGFNCLTSAWGYWWNNLW